MYRIALAMFLLGVGITAAADEPTRVVATTYYRTFSHAHPVLKRIKPGEVGGDADDRLGGARRQGREAVGAVQPAHRAVLRSRGPSRAMPWSSA